MSANLLDAPAYPVSGASRERWICSGTFTIGAAGAIDTSVVDDAQMAGDDFGSGVCNLTYPACTKARIQASLKSDGTVQEIVITALTPTSGTAVVKTTKAGVATEPESGAVIMIRIFGTVDAS